MKKAALSFLALLVLTAAASPTPAPLPDASPTTRGVVNTDPTQAFTAKTFNGRVSVNVTDGGPGIISTCAPSVAGLGLCLGPAINALQCVADAGWYACQPDAGWAQLGTGSGVTAVSGTGPIVSSGGATPAISCNAANGSQAGCLGSSDWSTFNGKESALTFSGPLSRTSNTIGVDPTATLSIASINSEVIDAGTVVTPYISAGVIDAGQYLGPSAGSLFSSTVAAGSGSFDWTFNTLNTRTSGVGVLQFQNNGSSIFNLDHAGNISNPGVIQAANGLVSNYWQSPNVGGLFATSGRGTGDPNCDICLAGPRNPNSSDGPSEGIALAEGGLEIFSVAVNGQVNGGSQYSPTAFKSSNEGSGTTWGQAAENNYMVLQGMLGEFKVAVQPDGGMPAFDGGTWVAYNSTDGGVGDGGTHYNYGGLHGEVNLVPYLTHEGGWLFEVQNAPAEGGATAYYIDSWGGFGVSSGLATNTFPPPAVNVPTSLGQFFYGTLESTNRYAVDTHAWYYMGLSGYERYLTDKNVQASIAPSIFNAYYDGAVLGAGTVVAENRFGFVATGVSLAFMPTKAGSDASHTFTVDAYDRSTGIVLCVTGTIACNIAAGTSTRVACSTAAGNAADDIDLRVNDSSCATVSLGNVSWVYH